MKIGLIGDSLTEGRPGVSFVSFLQKKFPNYRFDNLGKPGETVKSLHTRLTNSPLQKNYDLTFLWIGVNDVYSKLLKIQSQPVVKDHDEFKDYYRNILNNITSSSRYTIAVSPAIIGEDLDNEFNLELRDLSYIIQFITGKHSSIHFLDMNEVFLQLLSTGDRSNFINTSILNIMKDALFYKSPPRIDHLSFKRGLRYTIDGIHLNSHGATIVAEKYGAYIEELLQL
ncbi:GDSL-type esterase/lipase family protein [Rossellomorea aquimaris]|jgi:lysophospholipase L1-like esterase|uniref:SGNH/GDSL hydrolase family protein n=1 Tax=Rossellomorea aquimaris TaxID=189382 RepID=A0A5D4TSY8_9BACI|nr:GDSL-type esterase/lipase family protein [Rossellomorea aquimaris]TYS79000.1 SGNH/GDSL hydrolase family protein [Rossellomorea aquimaris]TYS84745.1 SGNH/GDSL hydrolase family protein [Rossellomorea aquimaris]